MDPTRPKPEEDPFAVDDEEVTDEVDDESLDWADAPAAAPPDPFESVDDDDGTELSTPEPAASTEAPTVDDEAGDDFDLPLPTGELDDRVRIPWQTEVVVVVRGKTLPAVLDPTAECSTWVNGPIDVNGKEQVIWLDRLTLRITLLTAPGDEEHVRLGRDAIGGKVLIEA